MTYPGPPPSVRIGLWGATGSGKTTYLAAIQVAVHRQGARSTGDNWVLNGVDPESSEFLQQRTHELVTKRVFPRQTNVASSYCWRFTGEVRGGRMIKRTRTVSFELDVYDVPGVLFSSNSQAPVTFAEAEPQSGGLNFGEAPAPVGVAQVAPSNDQEERLLEHLENSDGILFLFDPIRDARTGDAYEYFQSMLEKLTARTIGLDSHVGGRLPHFLAVCVTKFDEPEIYRRARGYRMTTTDMEQPFAPRVPDEQARFFFERLCRDTPGSTADLVRGSIQAHFSPDRVGFFVTSAVGFYVGPTGRFQPADLSNVELGQGGAKIRGGVYPINVLEPLIWLEEKIRASKPRGQR